MESQGLGLGEERDPLLRTIYIIQSTDMTVDGKHEGSGKAVREREDDLCFNRGTIPTLDEKKCAYMHSQKLK